jgi:hypothetical protein
LLGSAKQHHRSATRHREPRDGKPDAATPACDSEPFSLNIHATISIIRSFCMHQNVSG